MDIFIICLFLIFIIQVADQLVASGFQDTSDLLNITATRLQKELNGNALVDKDRGRDRDRDRDQGGLKSGGGVRLISLDDCSEVLRVVRALYSNAKRPRIDEDNDGSNGNGGNKGNGGDDGGAIDMMRRDSNIDTNSNSNSNRSIPAIDTCIGSVSSQSLPRSLTQTPNNQGR